MKVFWVFFFALLVQFFKSFSDVFAAVTRCSEGRKTFFYKEEEEISNINVLCFIFVLNPFHFHPSSKQYNFLKYRKENREKNESLRQNAGCKGHYYTLDLYVCFCKTWEITHTYEHKCCTLIKTHSLKLFT